VSVSVSIRTYLIRHADKYGSKFSPNNILLYGLKMLACNKFVTD